MPTVAVTFKQVIVQGMDVFLTEVAAQSWGFGEAWCILEKAGCSLSLGCRYEVHG